MTLATNSSATHSIAELITEFHKTTGNVPPPLIGATTTLANQNIYLFGGRLQSTRQISNLVYVLSLRTHTWETIQPENRPPSPRYFHSASYSDNHNYIFFFGGMGIVKDEEGKELLTALNDLVSLDLQTMAWTHYPGFADKNNRLSLPTPRYAHISTCIKNSIVIMGGQDIDNEYIEEINVYDIKKKTWHSPISSQNQQYGAYRSAAVTVTPIELTPPFTPTMDLLTDTYDDIQEVSRDAVYSNILVYSNINGIESVSRKFHTWKLSYDQELDTELEDQSENISFGNSPPPSFKFPSAFMCGQQFILAGPHFSPMSQQFQIWALDTTTFIWTKIEVSSAFSQGSWLRGLLDEDNNRFVVFGDPNGSMQEDHRSRVHCFKYIACVDIEIFGVYKPPRSTYSSFGQGLGLALLKDPILSDLKIVSSDQQCVLVNSAVLAQRWPSIARLIKPILEPSADGSEINSLNYEKRQLHFPDTYVVLIAFLQFIYTDHLVTAQQHQPQILARLLFIADLFEVPRLKALATHALHQMLNIQTATMIYESASLSNAVSLQIRALRVMINAKKMMQRQKQMELKKRQLAEEQQQLKQHSLSERPSSPPATPLVSHSSSLKLFLSQQQNQTSSRFLQKHEMTSHQQQQQQQHNTIPVTPKENIRAYHNISPFTPPPFNQHHRTPSKRSVATIQSAPTTPAINKSIRLPTFRMRQTSSPHVVMTANSNDVEYPLPKVTPSVSMTLNSKPTTAASFWKQTSVSSSSLSSSVKKKNGLSSSNISSKSEGTARLNAFNFLNNNSHS
ncbi:MAG: hypothetical protein EXX96DRAFT_529108 [Benjaminiella poitrasii]|nr:MAG: hypothetical protein EXX96DRAFT_529108 [Benjaminiella poitrasii]